MRRKVTWANAEDFKDETNNAIPPKLEATFELARPCALGRDMGHVLLIQPVKLKEIILIRNKARKSCFLFILSVFNESFQ